MSSSEASLAGIVPAPIWAAGARLGWRFDSVRLLGTDSVVITLFHEPTRATFAIELLPASNDGKAFHRAGRVQAGHRDPLAAAPDERAWQLALLVFLSRAADRALDEQGGLIPAVFGLRAATAAARGETSCELATYALNVDVFGGLKPCCLFERQLTDDAGRPCHVPDVSLGRIMNGKDLTSVRTALDSGMRIPECARCWRTERHNRMSKRMSHPVEDTGRQVAPGTLRSLTVFSSSRCNLRCRTCDAKASSSIAAEQMRLLARKPDAAELLGSTPDELRALPGSWLSRGPEAWAWLGDQLTELERLEFLGGEPLLHDEHFDLLAACVDGGVAHRIALEYATNGTQVPRRARELWPAFKSVRIQVSLDAVGARFEYLRHAARWAEVEANIATLSGLSPKAKLAVNATTSIYNVLYLDELVAWSADRAIELVLNPLGGPRHFDPRVLTAPAKAAVRARLEACRVKPELADEFASFLDEMESADWSDEELPRFFAHTRLLDEARKENFAATFPELASLLHSRARGGRPAPA